jgi:hypothetical protein
VLALDELNDRFGHDIVRLGNAVGDGAVVAAGDFEVGGIGVACGFEGGDK